MEGFEMSTKMKHFTIALVTTITFSVLIFGQIAIKKSDAFNSAMQFIRDNDEVKDEIGKVEKPGFWISGNLNSPDGFSDFEFDVIGSKGKISVAVELSSNQYGVWTVKAFNILPKNP